MRRSLYLHNTFSRSKEHFEPLRDMVSMYCCGPTVYNYAHIGNLRTYIFEDVLKRVLGELGYSVKHIVNITDVGHLTSDEDFGDDKMEKGARKEGKTVWDIARFYTECFKNDLKSLNIIEPDMWPKATDHIEHMIQMIGELESKGFTYRTSDGIYFDTTRFPSYCDFARLDPSSLRAGERVEMGEKRTITDFALWKFSPVDTKRQMEWESPWGRGFPGWHIECSAMSRAYLPLPIDIHCGGADHIRVHHTNEIAQTEALTDKKFVRFWVHGEFLVVDKGKMAKSGENFVTLDVLKSKGFSALAYRMFCFTAHYRSPLSFSWEGVAAAEQSLKNLRKLVPLQAVAGCSVSNDVIDRILEPFFEAVCDDLNMPRAVAALWGILRNSSYSEDEKRIAAQAADRILGLNLCGKGINISGSSAISFSETGQPSGRTENGFEYHSVDSTNGKRTTILSKNELSNERRDEIFEIVSLRSVAKSSKDFATSDRIRHKLGSEGIALKDMPDGTTEVTIN